MELKLLADVGLLGFPNAGKSTFVRAVSAATPKVADYPFTTLYPNLGVVSVEPGRSFVIADIPGLIEGAADGAGLGSLFLRHVQRTRLLLHLVDSRRWRAEWKCRQPSRFARSRTSCAKYDPAMLEKPRWLVLNKADLLFEDEARERAAEVVAALGLDAALVPGLGDRARRHLADHAGGAVVLRSAEGRGAGSGQRAGASGA